jgi:hypothetical protein
VAQGIGPEFKYQYWKKKKKELHEADSAEQNLKRTVGG